MTAPNRTLIDLVPCEDCGTNFRRRTRLSRYCSPTCSRRAEQARRQLARIVPAGAMATGTVGGISELLVCVDLMKHGYHVFRAQSSHGPCDLVAFRRGEPCLKVEVRTGTVSLSTGSVSFAHPKLSRDYDVLAVVTTSGVVYQPPL